MMLITDMITVMITVRITVMITVMRTVRTQAEEDGVLTRSGSLNM